LGVEQEGCNGGFIARTQWLENGLLDAVGNPGAVMAHERDYTAGVK
jgi:hypothetical protein